MAMRLGSDQTGWATVVWVDPGGTTGWGVMSVDPCALVGNHRPLHHSIEHWVCGDTKGNEDQMASAMLELYAMWEDAAIGIESFTVRKFLQHREFLSPVRIRAKIEYGLWLAEKWDAADDEREVGRPRRLFTQDPSLAKTKLTDERQREFGLWEPGADHKRDAIKHCYTFLSKCRESPRMRYYAWPTLFRSDGEPMKRRPPTSKRSNR
jgi:hypothetical protein